MPLQSQFLVILSESERQHLESIARQYTSPYCDVIRAKASLGRHRRSLLCQHRGRVGNATVMLRQKLDSLVELDERIKKLHRQGLGEAQISQALPGSDLLWRLWTGVHFSKRNFVRAFLRSLQHPNRPA